MFYDGIIWPNEGDNVTKSGKFTDPVAQFRTDALAIRANRRNHAAVGKTQRWGSLAEQAKLATAGLSLVHSNPQPRNSQGGPRRPVPEIVAFNRQELATLLNVYGRKVSAGDWRDYAMDFLKDRALFSVYQRNSERPMFVIEKNPKLRNKQGQYMVTNHQGRVLKRGQVLEQVLRVLDAQFAVVK